MTETVIFALPRSTMPSPVLTTASGGCLNLPHDWGIEGPFNSRCPAGPAGCRGSASRGIASISTSRRPSGQAILPGCGRRHGLLDGLAQRPLRGRLALRLRLVAGGPDALYQFRRGNTLAIRLNNPQDSSRWYPGGGIYRNVWLTKTRPCMWRTGAPISPRRSSARPGLGGGPQSRWKTTANAAPSPWKPKSSNWTPMGAKRGDAVADQVRILDLPAGRQPTSRVEMAIAHPKLGTSISPTVMWRSPR